MHTLSSEQRVALVTGASKGLGRAIAIRLGRAGCRVAVNYHSDRAGAEATVSAIRDAGGEAIALGADVTDEAAVRGLVAEIARVWGPVDILVNNATGPQPMKPVEHYAWADYAAQLDYFVKAPLLLTQATLAEMKHRRRGRIIHIGSEVADLGVPNFSAYVAAKAAMVGLTRAWAAELGPWQITVNLVSPGWIPVERHADVDAEALRGYAEGVPLRRQGTPEDVAAAVVYLASDAANFVTGQRIAVNGGKTV